VSPEPPPPPPEASGGPPPVPPAVPPSSLALLGVGYIGGSVALAARRAGRAARVVGYDPDARAIAVARAVGIIDHAAATPAEAVAGASVVVLAGPVASLGELARQIAGAVDAAALVVDVGSVKAPIVEAVEAALPGGRFVACHPLAGTERSGAAAADVELFREKLCFLCPTARTSPQALDEAGAFWRALGARVQEIAPEPHDALMAAVSHLPHVAAFALAATLAAEAESLAAYTFAPTTSLRDTTRIAASNAAVWRDIFLVNREHLLPLARVLERQVSDLRAAIEASDGAAVERLLDSGRACRDRLFRGG
jgi:prephenate dehydrogenase